MPSTPPNASPTYEQSKAESANGRDPGVGCTAGSPACLSKQKRRVRDRVHKASRAVVQWAKEHQVSALVIGDVRDVADGQRLGALSQQKIGVWSHGRQRQYLTYKAEAAGMAVTLIDEVSTSQTCPACM